MLAVLSDSGAPDASSEVAEKCVLVFVLTVFGDATTLWPEKFKPCQ